MHGGWRWVVEIERIRTSDRGRCNINMLAGFLKIEKASKGLPICPSALVSFSIFCFDARRTGQRSGELELSSPSLTERLKESRDRTTVGYH